MWYTALLWGNFILINLSWFVFAWYSIRFILHLVGRGKNSFKLHVISSFWRQNSFKLPTLTLISIYISFHIFKAHLIKGICNFIVCLNILPATCKLKWEYVFPSTLYPTIVWTGVCSQFFFYQNLESIIL